MEFLATIADLTDKNCIILEINEKSQISDLYCLLKDKFGKRFEDIVFDSDGELSKYVLISINNNEISSLNGSDTLLGMDDKILFIPAIAGG